MKRNYALPLSKFVLPYYLEFGVGIKTFLFFAF